MERVGMVGIVIVAAVAAAVALAIALRHRRRRVRISVVLGVLVVGALGVTIASAASAPVHERRFASEQTPALLITPVAPTARWVPTALQRGPGYRGVTRLDIPAFPAELRQTALRLPERLPSGGEVGSVVIPATRSHFVARPAIVYLPPAARVTQPRLLPVVVMFSGQSRGAGPLDLVRSGHLRAMMNAVAAKHDGVAPIVVVPDQLGPASGNPMCVDSKRLGNSAQYIMSDVRRWILSHLPVETGRRDWTVAGFSQGGTCSIQFAAAHPGVFGSVVDISGENAPTNGTLAHTIAVGFGGSARRYEHATPAWLLAHHRYRGMEAYFAVGALDKHYGPVEPVMAARARRAGMTTHLKLLAHVRHNWITGSEGLAWGIDHLAGWWGI